MIWLGKSIRQFVTYVLSEFFHFISALEALEGETLTLTCPRPSTSPGLPVVWQGPPSFQQYTRGLDVSIQLASELRARLSLSGDHSNGYYNLNIESVKKSDSGTYRCLIGSRVVRKIRLDIKTQGNGDMLFLSCGIILNILKFLWHFLVGSINSILIS